MRWTRKFKTFEKWRLHRNKKTPYYKRIRKYHKKYPQATLKEARGHKPKITETMFRNTLGTQMSDKAQLYSFTLFAYSLEELDESDLNRLQKKFEDLIGKWLAQHYSRSYDFKDYWGVEIYRKEENVEITYDKEDCGYWFFEVNAQEVESGILTI